MPGDAPAAAAVEGVSTVAADAAIREFAAALKAELGAALAEGGPVAAVQVCHHRAAAIADEVGARHAMRLRRTTLKPRNPANSPDAWERSRLVAFEEELAAGKSAAELSALVRSQDGAGFRYMKPIVTAPLCLACHGVSLQPELVEVLDELYPDDRARGYEAGELRGAFSVWWPAAASK